MEKKKKILQVFNTATDAYLEYVNNFLTKERFTEYFNLDEMEVERLFSARADQRNNEQPWNTIDYYFQKMNNRKYLQRNIHW